MESLDATTKSRSAQGERDFHGQQRHPSSSPCGGSPEKGGCQALGRSKGGFGTKIHILVDELGRLLKLVLSPGQSSDHRHASTLAGQALEHHAPTVMGDKGYDSNALRAQISYQWNTKFYLDRDVVGNELYQLNPTEQHAKSYEEPVSGLVNTWLNRSNGRGQ